MSLSLPWSVPSDVIYACVNCQPESPYTRPVSSAAPAPASDGPALRRRLSPTDRRAQLVAAGAQVFTERGYQGTSLEDIAARAGVTRPLIYRYFRDKDELYREILRNARAELDAALLAAVDPAQEPAEQLRAGLSAYFTFVRDRAQHWDVLFGGGTAVAGTVAEEAARLRFETADMVAALVGRAVPHVPERAVSAYAHAISGAAEQLTKWWRRHPEAEVAELVDYLRDVVWGGLERLAP